MHVCTFLLHNGALWDMSLKQCGICEVGHWGRVTHICVSKLPIIGSDNGLSPGRRQAIIWTNAVILLIWPLGTNLSEILIKINTFSFKKMHLKMSSGKWRPFCLGLNVLICPSTTYMLSVHDFLCPDLLAYTRDIATEFKRRRETKTRPNGLQGHKKIITKYGLGWTTIRIELVK